MNEPINLAGRRERAPQPADGPPAITFGMDDDRIIFRDQAALDDYLSGAITEATEAIERERATWAAAWVFLAADDTAALNAARAEAWDEAAEATADWMWNNPGPSGIPNDPPRNPYEVQP